MRLTKNLLVSLVGVGLGTAVVPVANAADAAALAAERCEACHGKAGVTQRQDIGSIAGSSAYYLQTQLEMYKSGERPGEKYQVKGQPETMNEVAKKLSDEEIKALAKYYAEQPYKAYNQKVDEAQAAKGAKVQEAACENCHTEGGSVADDDASILAGQPIEALRSMFKQIGAGTRPYPKKMTSNFQELSKEDQEALIQYYAGQQ
jgi:cytochrome subunit of sulfide dehydrogenase